MSAKIRITGFLCNWCSYAGADLAGVSRISYPPTLRVVRVMCSGRVDPVFVLDAFLAGSDGVLIGGCHIGDCHYQRGNVAAVSTVSLLTRILHHVGINPGRLRLEWISAGEGNRFAEVVTDFTDFLERLDNIDGETGIATSNLQLKLKAARCAVSGDKLRWISSRYDRFLEMGNRYGERFTAHELGRMLDGVIIEELLIHQILLMLDKGPMEKEEIIHRLDVHATKTELWLDHLAGKKRIGVSKATNGSRIYNLREDCHV